MKINFPHFLEIILILIILLLRNASSKNIIIPFNETIIFNNNTEKYSINQFFFDTYNNSFFLKFQIGTPYRNIISKFSINNSDLSIKYTNETNFIGDYDPLKSSSFINNTGIEIENKKNGFSFITENLKLIGLNNVYTINNYKLFIENNNINNNLVYLYAELGFNYYSRSEFNNESYIFLNQLKTNNIINNKIFSVDYNDNKLGGGNIYIGDYPHNFKESLPYYKNHKLFQLKDSSTVMDSFFFNINEDHKGDKKIFKIENVYFNISSPVIFGTSQFISKIDEIFFQKYEGFNVCFHKNFYFNNKMYLVYNCIKQNGEFKLKLDEFPDLNFYNKDLNYTFTLNYEDLFIEINDVYYFLVVYDFYSELTWKFGRPFLQKYKFVFNCENYSLSFYDIEKYTKNDEKEEVNNNGSYNFKLIILLLILMIILNISLLLLVIKLIKYKKKIRNKRACELENDEDGNDYFYDDQKNINSS